MEKNFELESMAYDSLTAEIKKMFDSKKHEIHAAKDAEKMHEIAHEIYMESVASCEMMNHVQEFKEMSEDEYGESWYDDVTEDCMDSIMSDCISEHVKEYIRRNGESDGVNLLCYPCSTCSTSDVEMDVINITYCPEDDSVSVLASEWDDEEQSFWGLEDIFESIDDFYKVFETK